MFNFEMCLNLAQRVSLRSLKHKNTRIHNESLSLI